jgi:hypothetical protein
VFVELLNNVDLQLLQEGVLKTRFFDDSAIPAITYCKCTYLCLNCQGDLA